jgi:hypothetical protein
LADQGMDGRMLFPHSVGQPTELRGAAGEDGRGALPPGLQWRSRTGGLRFTQESARLDDLAQRELVHSKQWFLRRETAAAGLPVSSRIPLPATGLRELAGRGLASGPSRVTVHRVLFRNGLVCTQEQQHPCKYRWWQREAPMHLWQMDLVGGVPLADGRECKMVTDIDDHSRFVVKAAAVDSRSRICSRGPRLHGRMQPPRRTERVRPGDTCP